MSTLEWKKKDEKVRERERERKKERERERKKRKKKQGRGSKKWHKTERKHFHWRNNYERNIKSNLQEDGNENKYIRKQIKALNC